MQSHPKQYQQIAQNKVKSRESTIEGGDVGVEGGDGALSREVATVRCQC
jgi:hypothetical protein